MNCDGHDVYDLEVGLFDGSRRLGTYYGLSIEGANNQHGVTGNIEREVIKKGCMATGTSSTRRPSTEAGLAGPSERSCETENRRRALLLTLRYPIQPGGLSANGKLSTLRARVYSFRQQTESRPAYILLCQACRLMGGCLWGWRIWGGPASISTMCVPRGFVMVPHSSVRASLALIIIVCATQHRNYAIVWVDKPQGKFLAA